MKNAWKKNKPALIGGAVALGILLLLVVIYHVFNTTIGPFQKIKETIEKDLPTKPMVDVLQKDMLAIAFGDKDLIVAALALLGKSRVRGDPAMPSDVFSVMILTDKTDPSAPLDSEEMAKRSTLITLSTQGANVSKQVEGGWLEGMVGRAMFTNYFSVVLDTLGRGLDFFAMDEMQMKVDAIYEDVKRGDVRSLANYFEVPRKIGVILPNLLPIASHLGIRITVASIVAEVCVSQESSGRLLLSCESERDAVKVVDHAEKLRNKALTLLVGGPGKENDPKWRYSRRRPAAAYINKVRVRRVGAMVQISGKVPDVVLRRLLATAPRMANRLARARAGLRGRTPENIYRGMEGPPETVALIKGAKQVNWTEPRQKGQVGGAPAPAE